jgi:DNA-binding XRE family transcriptional regulator
MGQPTVPRIEAGHPAFLRTARLLASALHVQVADLMGQPPELMARTASVMLPSLVYWRVRRGFTQERLAQRLGMHSNTVWRIEAGYPARARTARLLASVLHVHLAVLMDQPRES